MIFKNFRKIFGNLGKCSEIFGNSSKVIFKCFYDFLKFSEKLQISSENFGNGSKVIKLCFLKFSENLWKSSENFQTLLEMFVMVCRS